MDASRSNDFVRRTARVDVSRSNDFVRRTARGFLAALVLALALAPALASLSAVPTAVTVRVVVGAAEAEPPLEAGAACGGDRLATTSTLVIAKPAREKAVGSRSLMSVRRLTAFGRSHQGRAL